MTKRMAQLRDKIKKEALREIVLERLTFAAGRRFTRFAIEAKLGVEWDWEADQLCVKVVQQVLAEHLENQKVEVPIDWWEHFKLRWFPVWLLKRFPVKFKIIMIEAMALYPKIGMPSEEYLIKYMKEEGELMRWNNETQE